MHATRAIDLYAFRTECRRIKDGVIEEAKTKAMNFVEEGLAYDQCIDKADSLVANAFADFSAKIAESFSKEAYRKLVATQIEKEKASFINSLSEELLGLMYFSNRLMGENDSDRTEPNSDDDDEGDSSSSDMDLDKSDSKTLPPFPRYSSFSENEYD